MTLIRLEGPPLKAFCAPFAGYRNAPVRQINCAERTAQGAASLRQGPRPFPARGRRLTPRKRVPRIARLCRAGLIDTPAPETATYEYRAASEGGPVFL